MHPLKCRYTASTIDRCQICNIVREVVSSMLASRIENASTMSHSTYLMTVSDIVEFSRPPSLREMGSIERQSKYVDGTGSQHRSCIKTSSMNSGDLVQTSYRNKEAVYVPANCSIFRAPCCNARCERGASAVRQIPRKKTIRQGYR
jgi:hypothetical protein